MNNARTILSTLALTLAATPAFAAQTNHIYSSGLLVLVFLGFCALVVVAQLIPAIMTMIGMLKGSAEKTGVTAEAKNR